MVGTKERGMSRIVQEVEKPKNLYAQPMESNKGRKWIAGGKRGTLWREAKAEKLGQL